MTPKTDSGFLRIAIQRTVVIRAFRIALVVGSVLALINHGDRLVSGQISGSVFLKIGMTFLVPYGVSTFSSVLAVREKLQSVEPKQN